MSGVRSVVWTLDNHRTWFPVYLRHSAPSSPLRFTTLTNKQVITSDVRIWLNEWHGPLSLSDYMVWLTSRLDSKWRWHYPEDLYLPVCPDPGSSLRATPALTKVGMDTWDCTRTRANMGQCAADSGEWLVCAPIRSPLPQQVWLVFLLQGGPRNLSTWFHPILQMSVLYKQYLIRGDRKDKCNAYLSFNQTVYNSWLPYRLTDRWPVIQAAVQPAITTINNL